MQSNVHGLVDSWCKGERVHTLRTVGTEARLQNIKHFAIYCHLEHLYFCLDYSSQHKSSVDGFISVRRPSWRDVRLVESKVTVK